MAKSKQDKEAAPKVEQESKKAEPGLKFHGGPADPDAREAYGLN